MLSDAYVLATCDNCGTDAEIGLPYVYRVMSLSSGYYDYRNPRLKEAGWVVDGEKHYCCRECLEEA